MPGIQPSPVLLITFNRPSTTRVVLDRIRQACVPVLYVFNDAPRAGNEEDRAARQEIAALLNAIDWPCEVRRFFPDHNMGCGHGVSSAITWVFEQEDRLIVLEDDCVPDINFFDYCYHMLERYAADERVWMVSGNNYSEEYQLKDSYTFSHNAIHIHGWATWRRSWLRYDLHLGALPGFLAGGGFYKLFPARQARFWTGKYRKLYEDRASVASSTWDFQWLLVLFVNAGLVIVPRKNMVTNIGYQGSHNAVKNHSHDRKTDPGFRIETHPSEVAVNRLYDDHHWKYCWMKRPSVLQRVKRKLIKLTASR